jgi:glycosyltransferase involved in cell wall biosynthesis
MDQNVRLHATGQTNRLRDVANRLRTFAYFAWRCPWVKRCGFVRIPWSVRLWSPHRDISLGNRVQFGADCFVQCDLTVGDGPERAAVEAEASRQGVPLSLLRHVPNEMLPALYRRCRVFAIPSVREGNPKALLEAMACGVACVGTATPGIVDLITSGINGLLCDDSPESLASSIMRLLSDDDLRTRLGRAARAKVLARNSLSKILACYEDAIVALAAGEDPRGVSHTSDQAA